MNSVSTPPCSSLEKVSLRLDSSFTEQVIFSATFGDFILLVLLFVMESFRSECQQDESEVSLDADLTVSLPGINPFRALGMVPTAPSLFSPVPI